ncbi:MAG: hypothetical protein ACT4OM_04390 [Actinomycetota bacterium]
MRWSVGISAEGDEVMSQEQILELADAVAIHSGVATGINQQRYGAQIIVEADNRTLAEQIGKKLFAEAVQQAALPVWPITSVETLSEEEDGQPDMY